MSTEPALRSIMPTQAVRHTHIAPVKLVRSVWSHLEVVIFVTGSWWALAALATSRSSCPSDRMAVCTARMAPFSVLRSAGIARAVTPSALISSMASWSGLRLVTASATPSAPRASAIERPIPVEPPVISAVLPARSLSNYPAFSRASQVD